MEFFKNIWDAIMKFYSSQPLVTFLISVGLLLVVIALVVTLICTTVKSKKVAKCLKADLEKYQSDIKAASEEMESFKLELSEHIQEETKLKLRANELETVVADLKAELGIRTEELEYAKTSYDTAVSDLKFCVTERDAYRAENEELKAELADTSKFDSEIAALTADKDLLAAEKIALEGNLEDIKSAYERVVKELNKVRTENDILISTIHIKAPGKAKKASRKAAAKPPVKEYEELTKMTRTELSALAKEHGLTGYTQLKRSELVPFIYERITK